QMNKVNTISLENLKLEQIINELVCLYSSQAAFKSISVVNEIHGEMVVKADRNVLLLVLRNLISNAIKYSFENGSVKIHALQTHDNILLSVSDQGTGMSKTMVNELLRSTEVVSSKVGTQNEVGTGFGIMLSREFLLKMDSELFIDSVVGTGTTFTIKLKDGKCEQNAED